MSSWTDRYLNQAEFIANNYSKDPSTKVGALIVSKDNSILSQGWNGFPRGVKDYDFRLNDRELKYKLVVHAEVNAIFNAAHEGISLKESVMYMYNLPPCNVCAAAIIQSGIKEVHIRLRQDSDISRWKDSWAFSQMMFEEAGVYWTIQYTE
jgi:dCMP deaminase